MLREGDIMDIYTVSFFGHRRIGSEVVALEGRLEVEIRSLLDSKPYVELLVGRNGDFDLLISSVIHRLKRTYRDDNSSHIWVMPYLTADYRDNEESYWDYYDSVEICEAGAHFNNAFKARNYAMIDRSDLVICYVKESGRKENARKGTSGAYEAMRYARKKGVLCINLAIQEEIE